MPFKEVQQWVKQRGDKKSTQDPPSSPAYKADPPAHMAGPPAFMARRRTATFFAPDGHRNYVIQHLRLDPLTAATYEQAIQDGSHMIGRQSYGELCAMPQYELDYWGYLIYLEELTKARRRGEIEREIFVLQEKAQQEFYRGLNGIMRSDYRYKISRLEKELVEIQAIGGCRGLNSC
ncbi:hypothetical protein FACUT_2313 [Fusarium acutatum]|uniref:Uncharacterized protein n=1 Tax=Fusarium acutatum TaxID=78861 RepID=A0A8H4K3Y7_9HYPO|nr:hypothetical protein FACUT_2313 [Fusarium acutatum]